MTFVAMPTNHLSDAAPIPAISQSIAPEPVKRKTRETQKWVVQKTWTSANYTEDSKNAELQSLQEDDFGWTGGGVRPTANGSINTHLHKCGATSSLACPCQVRIQVDSSAAITTYTLSTRGSHCYPIDLTGKKLCWFVKRKLAPFIASADTLCSRKIWSHLQAQGVNILEFAKTDKRTQQVLDYIRRERDKLTLKVECSAFWGRVSVLQSSCTFE